MTLEREIRLVGQPILITIPGDPSLVYKHDYYPKVTVSGGMQLAGYILQGDEDTFDWHWRNIYIVIDNELYESNRFSADAHIGSLREHFPVSQFITFVQPEATIGRLQKIILLLYNKISSLEERIDSVE